MSSKKLLLAGGGHAHMMTLANLNVFVEKGYQVTVIQPSPYHYYSGMGPGMLSKTYSPEEIRFSTRHVVEKQGGTFILGKVTRVEPDSSLVHLESGETVPYDTVSFNIGSYVPAKVISGQTENIFTVKPIERLEIAQKKILQLSAEKTVKVSIIGGGASAVEIAGNVWGLTSRPGIHPADIQIFARTTIMGKFPDQIRLRAVQSLTSRNVEIFENCPVSGIQHNIIELESGRTYNADIIFMAVGVKPSQVFEKSGLTVGPDGGLIVNKYLQSIDYPNIFGGGDCIYFKEDPLDKVGVYAVRENPILLHNLMASLEETELKEFKPGGDYLLILNLGDGTGIFRRKPLLFGGRPAFWLKDYIDRKFMKKFQSLEKE
jgi:NADH dehydrogenase FAD-containing subunit